MWLKNQSKVSAAAKWTLKKGQKSSIEKYSSELYYQRVTSFNLFMEVCCELHLRESVFKVCHKSWSVDSAFYWSCRILGFRFHFLKEMSPQEMKFGSLFIILRPNFTVQMETTLLSSWEKIGQSRSIKVVALDFFDLDGIVWAKFILKNPTVNSDIMWTN